MRDSSRLKSQLLASGIQRSNNALFQVIDQLIKSLSEAETTIQDGNTTVISGGANANFDYLTHTNESGSLPNSRRLVAGTNITFDDTVANERTINGAAGSSSGYWTLLVDGDVLEPEFIFADGEPISVFVPL